MQVTEQYAESGEVMYVKLPFSEACIHMGVAGQTRAVLIVRNIRDGRDVFTAQVLKRGYDVCYHPNHSEPVELLSPALKQRHQDCGDFVAGYRFSSAITMSEAGFEHTPQGWLYREE